MSEQTPAVNDDLEAFSAELFGQSRTPEPASSEAQEEVNKDDAHIEQVQLDGADTPVGEDETPEEIEKLQEEAITPKKNRFQERVDDLTGKWRNAEREVEDLRKKLDALSNQTVKTEVPVQPEKVGPTVTDLDEHGEPKYPLGEFDPNFVADLTKHHITKAREDAIAEVKAQAEAEKESEAKAAQQAEWNSKLTPAAERYPDFFDKSAALVADLEAKLDPAYGSYLSERLMEMDHGTDVLYYLANNPEEAYALVAKGPVKATIALGHIEAKFIQAEAEKKLARPKVSNAPTPPPTNKGNNAAHVQVSADTDDLDAFESEFFPKKKR